MDRKTFCQGRRFGNALGKSRKDFACQCANYLLRSAKFFDGRGREIEIFPVLTDHRGPTKWTAFRRLRQRTDALSSATMTVGNREYEHVKGFPMLDGLCDALRALIDFQEKTGAATPSRSGIVASFGPRRAG